jgi:predicted nuclease of predicted toxin-antitoxin system
VKLLFDENLSPRLVESLRDVYPESQHVSSVELGGANDAAIWNYAKGQGFAAIVSKDSDFAERSVLEGRPPKVIWIRLGNCSTTEIEGQLRAAHESVLTFLEKDEETCLMLGRGGIGPTRAR